VAAVPDLVGTAADLAMAFAHRNILARPGVTAAIGFWRDG